MSWRQNPNPIVKPPFGSMVDPGHPLAKGLAGCWIFNEHSGLFVNDLSPYRNNGTIYGASWGDGLNFNGSSDYVELPIIFDAVSAGTISAQIKLATTGVKSYIYCGGDYHSRLYFERDSTDKLSAQFGDQNAFLGDTTLSSGVLYRVVLTWSGSSGKLYLNGVLDGTGISVTAGNSEAEAIGVYEQRYNSTRSDFFDGIIDEVPLYNRALSADEIEWLNAEPYCFIAWPSHRVIFDYGAVSGLSIPVAMSDYLRQMGA